MDKIRTTTIITVLLTLFTPMVLGATPLYNIETVNQSLEVNQTVPEVNVTVRLVDVQSQITSITSFQQNFELERYDAVRNELGEPISLQEPNGDQTTLNIGDTYSLSSQGNHQITGVQSSNTTQFTVEPFLRNVKVSGRDSNELRFNTTNSNTFSGIGDSQTYTLNYNDLESLTPNTYTETYNVLHGNGVSVYTENREITVSRRETFNVDSNTIPSEQRIQSDTETLYGTITYKQTGNTDYDLQQLIEGNASQFFDIRRNTQVFPDQTLEYDVFITVPRTVENGEYKGRYVASSTQQNYTYNFTVQVTDTTSPRITSVEFDHRKVGLPNTVRVRVEEENVVRNVSLNVNGRSVVLDKDRNTWIQDFTIKQPTDTVRVTASDNSDNTNTTRFEETFSLGTYYNLTEDTGFLTVEPSSQTKKFLLDVKNVTNPPLNVTLTDWFSQGVNNSDVSGVLRLETPSGRPENLDTGKTVSLDSVGVYELSYRPERQGRYEATFNITDPYGETETLFFTGRSSDYTIPESFEVRIGVNSTARCRGVDGGTKENSEIRCESTHPVGADVERNPVILSTAELNNMNTTITEFENRVTTRNTQIILLLVVGVAIFFGMWGVVEWMRTDYPYVRFRKQ